MIFLYYHKATFNYNANCNINKLINIEQTEDPNNSLNSIDWNKLRVNGLNEIFQRSYPNH